MRVMTLVTCYRADEPDDVLGQVVVPEIEWYNKAEFGYRDLRHAEMEALNRINLEVDHLTDYMDGRVILSDGEEAVISSVNIFVADYEL